MHNTGIYEIRNTVNGKRYVGSAVSFWNRWRTHVQSLKRGDHHSIALQRAWKAYGPAAFQFNKLLACSKENLILYEQICMDAYRPEYNIAPKAGSQLGFKMRPESRALLSESAKRTKNFSGRKHTEESKAKISESRKGKGGGQRTPERLAKIGAAHRGMPKSEEHKAKISATLMGHKQTPEQIEKRMQKIRGRKMPEGFSEAASARMLKENEKTEEQKSEVISLAASGVSRRKISRITGISRPVITRIIGEKNGRG